MYFVSLKKITNKKPKAMRLVFNTPRTVFPQTNKYQVINI